MHPLVRLMTAHEELIMMAPVMGDAPDIRNAERFRLALVKITKVNAGSPVLTYQEMERIAHEALNGEANSNSANPPLAE